MKKHLNYILFATVLVAAGMVGCKKKLDINTNPNLPPDTLVTVDLIMPNALHWAGSNTALGYGFLSNWMGYWAPSGSYNPSIEESSYNITNTFNEGKWINVYDNLFDLDRLEKKAIQTNETFYQAAAMIVKAHLFQNLVDIYGNIPYTQAFKSLEFPTPAYDDAKTIYEDLHKKLDDAIGLMENATVTGIIEKVDIMFHGDTDLWIKLANTIKLRLLIRTSNLTPNPAAELAKIKAKGGVLQSEETAGINPIYVNDVGKQSPFFATYGLLVSGEDANTFFRANAYAVQKFQSRNDPRLGYFFKPAKNPASPVTYLGNVYGSEPSTEFDGDHTSNIGEGLTKSAAQDQWLLTSVESMFLQAEAVVRGWDVGDPYGGDAQDAYEAAVTESFIWLGVEDAEDEAATYLGTTFGKWNAAASQADKITKVVHQKYISLTGINPLEAWNDYRRLGVPSDVPLSVLTARGDRLIPLRLLYPSTEYAVNAKNVQAQGSINPQQTKIFWDNN